MSERHPKRASVLRLGGLLVCLLGFTGCGPEAGLPTTRPNVLLITVDTLRPDHLGCYGYGRDTSPVIDALAARGVLFRYAITAAGRTVQSFPSILTGVYPMEHGLRYEGQSHEILTSRLTLTGALRSEGYGSFAVTQGLNVGLHRDFDMYDPDIYLDPQGNRVTVPTRNDREASRKASAWLRSRRENRSPFFLWLRYNAPHWPYEAPGEFAEKFDPGYDGAHTFNEEFSQGAERGAIVFGIERLPDREIEHAVAHYDGEIAYADAAIGDLLDTIATMGWRENTIVVLTSDHGESLGEHDYFFEHGAYLYDPSVRVPLIIAAPGLLPEGVVIDRQVRTIDIFPTVLELAGVRIPAGLQGVSLVSRARGEKTGAGPPAYSESGRNFYELNPRQYIGGVSGKWRMIRSDRYKLIMIPRDPEPVWELYDLVNDPGESRNVLNKLPEEAAALRETLLRLYGADPGREDRDEPPLPEGLRDHLRSLGYIGDGGEP